MLSLDLNLVWNIINILVLCFLVKRFLLKPINNVIDKRRNLIEKELVNASEAEKAAAALKRDYEDALKSANLKSADIVGEAKGRAEKEYERIVLKAGSDAGRLLEDARVLAEAERRKSLCDMESEIAGLAIKAARKVVGDVCNDEVNLSLYNQFIAEEGELNVSKDN